MNIRNRRPSPPHYQAGPALFLCVLLFTIPTLRADGPATTQPTTRPAAGHVKPHKPNADEIELSPLVRKLLTDKATTEAARRRLAIFHGQWDTIASPTTTEQAEIALAKYDLKNPALTDASVPPLLRARAALERGEPAAALGLLEKEQTAQAARVKAEAYEQLGRVPDAVAVLTPWRERLRGEPIQDAAELTAAAEGVVTLARLEGRPSQDYDLAMSLLAKARGELDRLYWPASLAEARLLEEKDNGPEAVDSILDALRLNPHAGGAWYLMGRITARGFDFERTAKCIEQLRKINPQHPLADMLEVHMNLTQRDPASARRVLDSVLPRFPEHREWIALDAATAAMAFDGARMQTAIFRFNKLAPGNPLATLVVGKYLSLARQYKLSETMLRLAVSKNPNWAEPRVELGLLLMQSGDEAGALVALKEATKLDPFNRRAANQLTLVEQLQGYGEVRTAHFIIKYKPGIDEALARDMAEPLEQIYQDITTIYAHKPANITLIEILPDERAFGVRITGTPDIWTIAASTGDVIALTPPRQGAKQRGSFDWARVIRHEFVHTVTLDQTHNRVPHWFTEACAVSQEPGGRDYSTCKLLANALRKNQLFALDQINWGFIRPKTPQDRPLAYAQAHWMLQYITATYGHKAVVELLRLYSYIPGPEDAMTRVTGKPPADFLAEFKRWAAADVRKWGLQEQPSDPRVTKVLSGSNPPDPAELKLLLGQYPEHPDLLHLAAQQALRGDDLEASRQAVLRYAAARPVDPWSDQMLVSLAARTHRPEEAIASLEQLDRQEQETGAWAHQLAQAYRSNDQLDLASQAADRSLQREPYNADYRELAATLALQRGDTDAALRHLRAMTIVEPDKSVHFVRLAALYAKLGRKDEAKAAAEQAKKLDENAPVTGFLGG